MALAEITRTANCCSPALDVVFLRLGFVGNLSVRSCSDESRYVVGVTSMLFSFRWFILSHNTSFCFASFAVVLPVASPLHGRVHDSDTMVGHDNDFAV